MNKHQQHEVLRTIGVYQQLAADLPALFGQQKPFKNLPKRKVNISASHRQQTLKVEHIAILNVTIAVPCGTHTHTHTHTHMSFDTRSRRTRAIFFFNFVTLFDTCMDKMEQFVSMCRCLY
jgi:hypothetical protein